METIQATSLLSPLPTPSENARNSIAALGSDDFLRLLVAELTNQDPLEPTGNEELLRQISSIRDIEMTTSLTKSLQDLSGQQRLGTASSLIGQYVTGTSSSNGTFESGVVVRIRFNQSGSPTLVLSNGIEISLDKVGTIESPQHAGRALIGKNIVGVDRRDPSDPQRIEGLVTAVRKNEHGETMLELDTGEEINLADVFGMSVSTTI